MEIQEQYIIKINEEEKEALKKFLGKFSENEKFDKGLNKEQRKIISEFWELLPYSDED